MRLIQVNPRLVNGYNAPSIQHPQLIKTKERLPPIQARPSNRHQPSHAEVFLLGHAGDLQQTVLVAVRSAGVLTLHLAVV